MVNWINIWYNKNTDVQKLEDIILKNNLLGKDYAMNTAEKEVKNNQLVPVSSAGAVQGAIKRNIVGISPSNYLTQVLSMIPDDFNGKLLEFPAGNQAYTAEKFRKISGAEITVADSDVDILLGTQKAYETAGLRYVTYNDGDMARLKHKDETFDYVLCINGLHSFADNVSTLREAARVMKKGGHLCGCCYVRGRRAFNDFRVNMFQARKGVYVPPFHTVSELERTMNSLFKVVEVKAVKSALIFHCIK